MGELPAVGMLPEFELLLRCAQLPWHVEARERMRDLVQHDLDWAALETRALRHGVLPLLYHSLSTTCPEAVPPEVLRQLQSLFRANAQRNFVLAGELLCCLDLLAQQGIRAIAYKGPVLAVELYGDVAMRQFGDLDLLVREQDAVRARDLLVAQGYRSEMRLNRAQDDAFRRDQSAYALVRADGALIVELHWRITEAYFGFALPMDGLWDRGRPMDLAGREVRTLSPEDLLLILCVHGSKHLWVRLTWIRDVARLLAAYPEMNWGWVIEEATRLGSERMLFVGLRLAHDWLAVALPEGVWARVAADPQAAALAGQVRQRLIQDEPAPLTQMQSILFHLRARERWRDRVLYCLRLVITPTLGDYACVQLPPPLFPLYYLLRPFRLVAHYLPRVLKGALRK